MTRSENYKRFLGKVCTVLVNSIGFPFKDGLQFAQFFSGKVIEVNEYGIWIKHLNNSTVAFYEFPLLGIVEEQAIPESDPQYIKIKEELEKKKEKPLPPKPPILPSNFTSIEEITKKIKESKR